MCVFFDAKALQDLSVHEKSYIVSEGKDGFILYAY